jgi:hypothetical protein
MDRQPDHVLTARAEDQHVPGGDWRRRVRWRLGTRGCCCRWTERSRWMFGMCRHCRGDAWWFRVKKWLICWNFMRPQGPAVDAPDRITGKCAAQSRGFRGTIPKRTTRLVQRPPGHSGQAAVHADIHREPAARTLGAVASAVVLDPGGEPMPASARGRAGEVTHPCQSRVAGSAHRGKAISPGGRHTFPGRWRSCRCCFTTRSPAGRTR